MNGILVCASGVISSCLFLMFQKNGRDFQKLKRALEPTELAATLNNLSVEQRMEYLEKHYEEVITEYRAVIERLATNVD